MTPSHRRAPSRALAVGVGALACLWLCADVASAEAPRPLFAGSVQVNYVHLARNPSPQPSLDAFTVEMSLKTEVELSDRVAVSAKICVACHGLEVGRGYVDIRVSEHLGVRAGRFTPGFGDYPSRHDPANHLTTDSPLPYDMGRMLRLREWNLGVLPAPWVDNGAELLASFEAGAATVDASAYVVNGPRGASDGADFDFIQSRTPSLYYADNNSEPSAGARVAVTTDTRRGTVTAGASVFAGRYDPATSLGFVVGGADLVVRHERAVVRAEYLYRRTEMFLGDAANRFKFGPGPDGEFDPDFTKHGAYAEVEVPIAPVTVLVRGDGLWRRGNVLMTSPLSARTSVVRGTVAAGLDIADRARLKTSAAYLRFSDFANEIVLHLALAAAF